ncbi:MAG TPA: ATP-binding protein [Polyangia bacterium]|nr:ATP-binding protein [Polyangia bacterium]
MGLLGRTTLIASLWERARDGQTVLLHGPVGSGKTAILDELRRRAARLDVPCGISPQTATLGDLTRALTQAYPVVDPTGRTQRRLRSGLRLAIAARPGVLLLDHVVAAGAAVKGFLRSLRGTGLGVVLAGDVEHPRDHARLRALGLAYREIAIPPLDGRYCARLLADGAHALLVEGDRIALVRMAEGRPGWALAIARRLSDERYWSGDRVRLELLRADVSIALRLRD